MIINFYFSFYDNRIYIIMKQDTINISDIFFGSEQSKYAGIALFMTIIILCLIILFTGSKIPIGERFLFVIFILIISVPSILMSLFELTCIVTGGTRDTRWWCWLLAWFISIIIILYCIMIIVSMLISMSNFEMANDRLDYTNEKNKVNKDDANMYAKNLLIENNYAETQAKQYVPPAPPAPQVPPSLPSPPAPQVVHATQSPHSNGIRQQPSLSQMQPPSYSEPKHNVSAGNMLSFPQNSSDLSGFEANDKYLSLENANTPAVNYSSEYKQKTNNSVSDYDGFDSDDKLSPF
jgi:uncharacterized membrane protein YhaH (DUF805 family)